MRSTINKPRGGRSGLTDRARAALARTRAARAELERVFGPARSRKVAAPRQAGHAPVVSAETDDADDADDAVRSRQLTPEHGGCMESTV